MSYSDLYRQAGVGGGGQRCLVYCSIVPVCTIWVISLGVTFVDRQGGQVAMFICSTGPVCSIVLKEPRCDVTGIKLLEISKTSFVYKHLTLLYYWYIKFIVVPVVLD